jgi:hypothetical protein
MNKNEQIDIGPSEPALLRRDKPGAFQLLHIIADLAIGDAEALAKGLQRRVTTGVFAGEAEQANITELRAASNASMLQDPVRGENPLKDFVGIKRRSDSHLRVPPES